MDVRQPFAFFPREHKHKYWKNNLRRFPGIAAQATFIYKVLEKFGLDEKYDLSD